MYLMFKCNGNAKYLTKNLKYKYTGDSFSALDVYLTEKRPSVKIQSLNIFKDYPIVAKSSPAAVGCNKWPLSNAL